MEKLLKYAVVGTVGYLIGFYEMKYKVTKSLLQTLCEKQEKSE